MKNETCFWCDREGDWPKVFDPYDAQYGFKGTTHMCPYCYSWRCLLAVSASHPLMTRVDYPYPKEA